MGEFEKETLRDKFNEAWQRELKQLLDPDTGELSLQFSQYIDCPLCGRDNSEEIFKKNGYTLLEKTSYYID